MTKDDKEKIQKIMNCLAYGRNIKSEWIDKDIETIRSIVKNDQKALDYFENQWFSNREKWIASGRDLKYALTNNISESINKKVKYYYLGGTLNMRVDTFVKKCLV